jgi:YfiH family protein
MRSERIAETWVWRERRGSVEVVFAGRGPAGERDEALRRIAPEAPGVAWPRQVHSSRVLVAGGAGCQGEGDALVSTGESLALCVVTADCVPVLLAGPYGLAAVHAGWRGIAAGVLPATLAGQIGLDRWTAWVGPAIGACCYEVGPDVAGQVAAASDAAVVRSRGSGEKPHLDLHAAVRRQLVAAGVGEVVCVPGCTRCDADRLHSYRRDGARAGRNHAFIWREGSQAARRGTCRTPIG